MRGKRWFEGRSPKDRRLPRARISSWLYATSLVKALVDETLAKAMKSGEINELYTKWFMRPVPPSNVSLNFPMSNAVREAYRNPGNKGI